MHSDQSRARMHAWQSCSACTQLPTLCGLCRLANAVATDTHKLPFRGTVSNGGVKIEQAKAGHSPPIWFVFCGAPSCIAATQLFPKLYDTQVQRALY